MIIFSNNAAYHLARHISAHISMQWGNYVIKHFSDGEIFVKINEEVYGKEVWIIAATQPPADNLIELFFLIDALQRAGASINLLITYFSYGRQVVAAPGEAHSAQVICSTLKNFVFSQIVIMHPHDILLHDFLLFEALYDLEFFCKQAEEYDAIAAPDEGASVLAKKIAEICKKDLILLTKTRPKHEEVKIMSIDGPATSKKILLVDDIISTGRTLCAAAQKLKESGAASVSAAATHGIFAPGAYDLIGKSELEKIYVTNTIAQHSQGKIKVIDISATIGKIIQKHNL